MPYFERFVKKEYKADLTAIRDDIINRRNKDFFWPNGTQIFTGPQGSGKTISAVTSVLTLKHRYPLALLVSNLLLTGMVQRSFKDENDLRKLLAEIDPRTEYVFFSDVSQLHIALVGVNNDFYGVIYLLDEIHLYFNSVAEGGSANVPMFVFTEISQQRKQRKLIIGTSQLFMRLSKPFREQCDNVITCRSLGYIIIQTMWDGATLEQDYSGKLKGNRRKTGFFLQTRKKREQYDTYQKVVSAVEQYETQNTVILENKKKFRR